MASIVEKENDIKKLEKNEIVLVWTTNLGTSPGIRKEDEGGILGTAKAGDYNYNEAGYAKSKIKIDGGRVCFVKKYVEVETSIGLLKTKCYKMLGTGSITYGAIYQMTFGGFGIRDGVSYRNEYNTMAFNLKSERWGEPVDRTIHDITKDYFDGGPTFNISPFSPDFGTDKKIQDGDFRIGGIPESNPSYLSPVYNPTVPDEVLAPWNFTDDVDTESKIRLWLANRGSMPLSFLYREGGTAEIEKDFYFTLTEENYFPMAEFGIFNAIITEDEEAGQKYVEDGTIPPDAKITGEDGKKVDLKDDESDNENEDGKKNDDKDETGLPDVSELKTSGNFAYKMNLSELRNFTTFFWSGFDIGDVLLNTVSGLYDGISNNVLSVSYFPLGSPNTTDREIKVGRLTTDIMGHSINQNLQTIDMGSVSVSEKFKSFVDYAPYTQLGLYLPYCGTVKIDTNIYMGTTLRVKLVIDLFTGNGTYLLFSDGTLINEFTCQIGYNIPFAVNSGIEMQSQIVGNAVSATTSLAVGATTGGVGLALGAVNALEGATVDAPPIDIKGSLSPASALASPQQCILYRVSPTYNRPSTYAKRSGMPCFKSYKLGSLNGFTQIDNPIIKTFSGTPPTQGEYEELISLLKKGVIL